jgi:hypothetical protein
MRSPGGCPMTPDDDELHVALTDFGVTYGAKVSSGRYRIEVAKDGEVLPLQMVLEAADMTGGVFPAVADKDSRLLGRRLRRVAVRASINTGLTVVLIDFDDQPFTVERIAKATPVE